MIERNTMWKAPLALSLLVAVGCGGVSMSSSAPDESAGAAEATAGGDSAEDGETMLAPSLGAEEQQTVDDYEEEVTQLVGDLDGAMELASPNCGRAADLRDAICDLAERICGIADDNPDYSDVGEQCDDGRSRCETARNRVGDRCSD